MENELSRRRVELIVKVLLDASKKVVAKVEYCLPKSDIGGSSSENTPRRAGGFLLSHLKSHPT
jgi:hypothetical protein